MDGFFRPGDFPCSIYCRTRDKTDKFNTNGRDFMETLWHDCVAFVDPDTLHRATENMPPVFWELYVAKALINSGISLRPQTRTKRSKKCRDLFATNLDVWIEAVLPELGSGPDAMEHPKLGVAYQTPVDPFILRLRSVFKTKANLILEYMQARLIQPGKQRSLLLAAACSLPQSAKVLFRELLKRFLVSGTSCFTSTKILVRSLITLLSIARRSRRKTKRL